jgi:cytochrome b561
MLLSARLCETGASGSEELMIRNTRDGWGWPAVALHWAVALLIVAAFALALVTDELPRPERPYYDFIHASIGITVLVILVARIAWALLNPTPAPPAGTPHWQHTAARLTHLSLYLLTLAVVLFGWMLAGLSTPPIEPQAFGLVPMPSPVTLSPAAEDFLEEAHEITAYALVALACLHALAALWHHFVLRDDILRRMLVSRARTPA